LERRAVAPLLPQLCGKRVLDLCCGTGRWLRILASYSPAFVVGMDLSAAMLGVALRSFRQLVQADCLRIPFAERLFDFVICSFAIGHITELARFARECARMLRPGGVLFVTDLHPRAYAMGWHTGFRDSQGAAEIRTVSHRWENTIHLFSSVGLACDGTHEFSFGEPEQEIFCRAGKSDLFCQALRVPAVLLCRFCRG
jgi:ubiquinone/menaquinone biosynthesis C-methylase UbiE